MMHNGMCGHIGPASCDLTLSDYIRRKTRDDAFNQVNEEKKLTFDVWWNRFASKNFSLDDEDSLRVYFERCWQEAQENK